MYAKLWMASSGTRIVPTVSSVCLKHSTTCSDHSMHRVHVLHVLPVWHCFPANPSGQSHVTKSTLWVHVPPFWQTLTSHGLLSKRERWALCMSNVYTWKASPWAKPRKCQGQSPKQFQGFTQGRDISYTHVYTLHVLPTPCTYQHDGSWESKNVFQTYMYCNNEFNGI